MPLPKVIVSSSYKGLSISRLNTAKNGLSWIVNHTLTRMLTNGERARPIRRILENNFNTTSSFNVRYCSSHVKPRVSFADRHIGPDNEAVQQMLEALEPRVTSLDEFVKQVLPASILSTHQLEVSTDYELSDVMSVPAYSEQQVLKKLKDMADKNKVYKNFIGCGYYGTYMPQVVRRNILEDPGWYTSYTPYQAEISQGRMESMLNFQTMVSDLVGLPVANASVLDEATAAAEALTFSLATWKNPAKSSDRVFIVSHLCHPQTIDVMKARADGAGVKLVVGDLLANNSESIRKVGSSLIGVLAQYPNTEGGVDNFAQMADLVHKYDGKLCVATDLLALTLLVPPGEFGADVAVGCAQRFGVTFGYGGPHAGFFACRSQHQRKIPGRLIGRSKDRIGNSALRLTLQTREQHIRREKATSNICTAQVLLANISAFYAIYHGPLGLKRIANRILGQTHMLRDAIRQLGFAAGSTDEHGEYQDFVFDTLTVDVSSVKGSSQEVLDFASSKYHINLRKINDTKIGISLDETTVGDDLVKIFRVFENFSPSGPSSKLKIWTDRFTSMDNEESGGAMSNELAKFGRKTEFLTNKVFNTYHSETEILRYINHLRSKDLSLIHSMIALGSCTMKLNATTEMVPITWPEFANIHPFVPLNQAKGYSKLIEELESDLAKITGFDAVTLQPNSGAQGEFTGLRIINEYFRHKGEEHRNICLIPVSAHGTNPASASMAGFKTVPIRCDTETGNLDIEDLKTKCELYRNELAAIMITYPSTFGVFEPLVQDACRIVHEHGGQVYMDGANMNAQIGLCSPRGIGADVCHLNLHKTFCIPHGGGGPGIGPVGVKSHLAPFLPKHCIVKTGGSMGIPAVSAAPFGSAGILPISWSYIKMMGGKGLTKATKITLLNANYILNRVKHHYSVLYTNSEGRCAHEFIIDLREFKSTAGVEALDIAKRLQDYGFHAPTMSWPVANTLMIEPTESESKEELDRFCDALISIRNEIREIEQGTQPKDINLLKMAPHPLKDLLADEPTWNRPYTRERAAYPLPWLREKKIWPTVARLDDAWGDSHIFCTCDPVE